MHTGTGLMSFGGERRQVRISTTFVIMVVIWKLLHASCALKTCGLRLSGVGWSGLLIGIGNYICLVTR
jgi:hypothetical protein